MPESQDSVGRRGFLKTAATSAAGIVAGAKPGSAHADPGPGSPGRSLRSHAAGQGARIPVGRQGPRRSRRARSHRRCVRDEDRSAQRRARRRARVGRPGIQEATAGRRVDRDGGARLPSSSGRGHRRAREHARRSTTWSSARCARATRGRSSAFRRCGTSRRRIVRVRSSIPAAC